MHVHEFWQLLREQAAATHLLEWIVFALGVAEVLLARVNNIWLYPTGITGTLLGIYLLMGSNLYADALLNAYYVVMSVYGWWYWHKRKGQPPVPVSYTTRSEWKIVIAIVFGGFGLLYVLLKNFTPSNVPIWDAWVSATGWAGMWLLAKRKIENWLLLNVSNIFAIPLLIYKDLPLLAVLTLILFIVACFGFFDWRKVYKKQLA